MSQWGKTALMYAVQRGNPEVIRLVLKFGADTTDYDNVGSRSRIAQISVICTDDILTSCMMHYRLERLSRNILRQHAEAEKRLLSS